MNKSETKQKDLYETPSILDIGPVSVIHGVDPIQSGPEDDENKDGEGGYSI